MFNIIKVMGYILGIHTVGVTCFIKYKQFKLWSSLITKCINQINGDQLGVLQIAQQTNKSDIFAKDFVYSLNLCIGSN